MYRHARSLLAFAVTTGVLISTLKLVNWLPAYFQPGAVRRYASIAAAQSSLAIPKIYVPAYFPKTLEWPPSRVLAQGKPFVAVVMEFRRVDSPEIALVITQTTSLRLRQRPKIHLQEVRNISSVNLKGRESDVEDGFCDDGQPCSKITFREGDFWIKIQMRSPAEELMVLAASLLSSPAQ